jgi:hypothetical protein
VVPFGMNVAASDTNGLPQSENTIWSNQTTKVEYTSKNVR